MPIAIKDSTIDITSEKLTKELAKEFTKYLKGGEFVFLYGEMGVGKTTFVKYFINEYQKINNLTQTEITSPTFSLLNENLLERLVVLENFLLFFQYLIVSNEKVIIALLFFTFSFYFNFNKKLFYFVIFLFSSYLALLLIIYFSTPYDLNYHLETSANRVVESLTLLLGFFSLYNLNILNKTS